MYFLSDFAPTVRLTENRAEFGRRGKDKKRRRRGRRRDNSALIVNGIAGGIVATYAGIRLLPIIKAQRKMNQTKKVWEETRQRMKNNQAAWNEKMKNKYRQRSTNTTSTVDAPRRMRTIYQVPE